MRARFAALALLATAAPATAHDRVVVKSAPQAFIFLREYWKLDAPSRSLFGLTYRLAENNRPVGAVLTLLDGAEETPLAATPDGWLTRLPTAEAFARHARVREDVPAGTHPSMQIVPQATLATFDAIEVADLRAAVAQLADVARRAGPLGFLIPRFTHVIFSGAQGASAVDADGRLTPLPILHGEPVLELDEAAQVRTVRFTRPPYHVLLAPARRGSRRAHATPG